MKGNHQNKGWIRKISSSNKIKPKKNNSKYKVYNWFSILGSINLIILINSFKSKKRYW